LALTVLSVGISVLVYFYLSLLLKFKELDQFWLLFSKLIKLKGSLFERKGIVEPYSETGTPA